MSCYQGKRRRHFPNAVPASAFVVTLIAVCLNCPLSTVASAEELVSPNGKIAIRFDVAKSGRLEYSVAHGGEPIVLKSGMGFELNGAAPLAEGFTVEQYTRGTHDETWKPVYGERSEIRDHYNQLVVDLKDGQSPPRRLQIIFRAYDEGAAFCYRIPDQPGMKQLRITRELSGFRFAADHTAWAVYSAQGRYERVSLSKIKPGCERPLVLQTDQGTHIAVAEARLVDYARMKLAPLAGESNALVSHLSSVVDAQLPLQTPWRVIMVGDSAGELLENNYLLLNLNDPCAIKDTSWIRLGKVIREVTLTTAGGKACVDFAAKHNLQYVEFDAGWYGHEYSDASDARTVTVDPKRSPGPLDLPEVIRYADERGIGILVYVNRRALDRQLDEILPLYQSWGIKGVKYGFVSVGSQKATRWLHDAVRKAADHQLMVDVHDEYRPTGFSRTYPNLMTQEGIAGDETSPTNAQTLSILFTRMVCGAGDNTICYFDPRVSRNACHAYQLAKPVCIYSPWQFLYWYDRPATAPQKKGGAGGSQNRIGDEPELEFFDAMPTVWDDTRVIDGAIGKYAVIARRSGDRWFVGCMTSTSACELEVPLDFLDAKTEYTAHIYSHDEDVATRTKVAIERRAVDSEDTLTIPLEVNGGAAIRIVPR